MGIDPAAAMAPALTQLYRAARAALLASVPAFDPAEIAVLRRDFAEIAKALGRG
ncbi:hypothetical protein ACFFF7_13580 [Novosphingobium aquiterrae]|uniref:MarR family transcriptional regulator n=1 Tax=Novosphingobium aquiterrae TaxID=624388 RepID=A0ABV6PKR7_9SPHN